MSEWRVALKPEMPVTLPIRTCHLNAIISISGWNLFIDNMDDLSPHHRSLVRVKHLLTKLESYWFIVNVILLNEISDIAVERV